MEQNQSKKLIIIIVGALAIILAGIVAYYFFYYLPQYNEKQLELQKNKQIQELQLLEEKQEKELELQQEQKDKELELQEKKQKEEMELQKEKLQSENELKCQKMADEYLEEMEIDLARYDQEIARAQTAYSSKLDTCLVFYTICDLTYYSSGTYTSECNLSTIEDVYGKYDSTYLLGSNEIDQSDTGFIEEKFNKWID